MILEMWLMMIFWRLHANISVDNNALWLQFVPTFKLYSWTTASSQKKSLSFSVSFRTRLAFQESWLWTSIIGGRGVKSLHPFIFLNIASLSLLVFHSAALLFPMPRILLLLTKHCKLPVLCMLRATHTNESLTSTLQRGLTIKLSCSLSHHSCFWNG